MRFKVIPEQRVFVTCDGQRFYERAEAEEHDRAEAAKILVTIRAALIGPLVTRALLGDIQLLEAMRRYVRCIDDLKEE